MGGTFEGQTQHGVLEEQTHQKLHSALGLPLSLQHFSKLFEHAVGRFSRNVEVKTFKQGFNEVRVVEQITDAEVGSEGDFHVDVEVLAEQ